MLSDIMISHHIISHHITSPHITSHHIPSQQIHEYALVLLALWGYGTKVADMIDCGIVVITSDEALEVMALCKGITL